MADEAEKSGMEEVQSSSDKRTSQKDHTIDSNGRLKAMGETELPVGKSVSSKKKKKKKKGKKECCDHDHHGHGHAVEHDDMDGHDHHHDHDSSQKPSANQIKDLQKFLDAMKVDGKPPKTTEEAKKKKYLFWDTQPVPKLGDDSMKPFILLI